MLRNEYERCSDKDTVSLRHAFGMLQNCSSPVINSWDVDNTNHSWLLSYSQLAPVGKWELNRIC